MNTCDPASLVPRTAYDKKRAFAKAAYKLAVATSKSIVTTTPPQVENRPFNVSGKY